MIRTPVLVEETSVQILDFLKVVQLKVTRRIWTQSESVQIIPVHADTSSATRTPCTHSLYTPWLPLRSQCFLNSRILRFPEWIMQVSTEWELKGLRKKTNIVSGNFCATNLQDPIWLRIRYTLLTWNGKWDLLLQPRNSAFPRTNVGLKQNRSPWMRRNKPAQKEWNSKWKIRRGKGDTKKEFIKKMELMYTWFTSITTCVSWIEHKNV